MGRPFVGRDRVAFEWWTTMIEEGEAVTLPGCLLLHFEAAPTGRSSSCMRQSTMVVEDHHGGS